MTDPIAARPPRPAPNSLLLKAAVVVPDVAIATLLWLVIIAALPPAVGFGATLAGLTLAAILAAAHGEDFTVRLLYRARRATPAEGPRLTVAWRLATHGLDADGLRLRIVPHGPPVATAGRRHVLLRRDVVDAYCANRVPARQVAGLIADGLGRLRHGHVRFDLLWTVWTIPWDLIRGAAYTPPRLHPTGPTRLADPPRRRHHRRHPRNPGRTLAVPDHHRDVHRTQLSADALAGGVAAAPDRSGCLFGRADSGPQSGSKLTVEGGPLARGLPPGPAPRAVRRTAEVDRRPTR